MPAAADACHSSHSSRTQPFWRSSAAPAASLRACSSIKRAALRAPLWVCCSASSVSHTLVSRAAPSRTSWRQQTVHPYRVRWGLFQAFKLEARAVWELRMIPAGRPSSTGTSRLPCRAGRMGCSGGRLRHPGTRIRDCSDCCSKRFASTPSATASCRAPIAAACAGCGTAVSAATEGLGAAACSAIGSSAAAGASWTRWGGRCGSAWLCEFCGRSSSRCLFPD